MDFNEYFHSKGVDESLWDEAYDSNLSDLITEARIHAGITQVELARRMGIKQPTIAKAESGQVTPSHEFLKRVAEAIGDKLLAPEFEFMRKKREGIHYEYTGTGVERTIPNAEKESFSTAQ